MYDNRPPWRFLSIRIAVFFLDLMRWSQLTAAISVCGLMFLALLAIALVTAEQRGADPLGVVLGALLRLPLIGTWLIDKAGDNGGTLSVRGSDLKDLALRSWAVLSVLAVLLEAVWVRLRRNSKPARPRPRRAILLVALGCAAYFAAMIALMISGREMFNGPTLQWVLTFFGMAVVMFLVGSWAVLVSRVITAGSDYLLSLDEESAGP